MSGMRPMGGGMGMGAYGWRRQDASVAGQKLAKGTLRRIVRFAKPYRWHITLFLLLVIVSAFLVIASPLLFKKIVDDGIIKETPVWSPRWPWSSPCSRWSRPRSA